MLPLLDAAYIRTGKVRYIFKDFVIFGPQSEWVAQLAECAGEQGQYWPVHDWLYRTQQSWVKRSEAKRIILEGLQTLNGLDVKALRTCVESGKYASEVQADTQEAGRIGARGTPAFMINGRPLTGYQPWPRLQAMIEQLLAEENTGQ